MMLRGPAADHAAIVLTIRRCPCSVATKPSLPLELAPSLHGDLRAIKLSFTLTVATTLHITSRLSGITPGEVIKLPVCVGGKHEVPNWKREKVDEHPGDVRHVVCGHDHEHSRKTKDQRQQNKRNNLRWVPDNGDNNWCKISCLKNVKSYDNQMWLNLPT